MITQYFQTVTVRMPPKGHASKLARIFLAQIPPRSRGDIALKFRLLPSCEKNANIEVQYSKFSSRKSLRRKDTNSEDGTKITFDPSNCSINEMFETFDRQSRKLRTEESIKG